jgi:hypothetical protein
MAFSHFAQQYQQFLILDGGDMHIQKWRQPNISLNMFQLSAILNRWKKPMSSYINEDSSLIYRSWIHSESTIVNGKHITCTSRVAVANFAHWNPFSFWW